MEKLWICCLVYWSVSGLWHNLFYSPFSYKNNSMSLFRPTLFKNFLFQNCCFFMSSCVLVYSVCFLLWLIVSLCWLAPETRIVYIFLLPKSCNSWFSCIFQSCTEIFRCICGESEVLSFHNLWFMVSKLHSWNKT